MGLLDFLFGAKGEEIPDPEQLRQALFQAAHQGKSSYLERLSRKNQERVLEHFPQWQQVPEPIRNDPAAMQQYVQAMLAIAQIFLHRLGCPDLINRLTGAEESNPLLRYQKRLNQARQQMSDLRYREARELLTDLLIEGRNLQGSGSDTYHPITLGCLAECYFQSGEAVKAIPHMEQALTLCLQSGDHEGVIAYLGNLHEAHRYLGQPEPAAQQAERLAEVLEQRKRPQESQRYRRIAEIVRAGEPRNRVVAILNGRTLELDELDPVENQRIQLVFARNRLTLHPATERTREGEKHGSEGKFEEALTCFREAAEADPWDPHCRYQMGYTLLQLGRYPQAVDSYAQTEDLAPGWFHCRADLWLAQQLALGRFTPEPAVAALVLADSPLPPKEKVRLAEQILTQEPKLALAHLVHGKNLAQLGHPAQARTAFQQGLECAEDSDLKSRLSMECAVLTDDIPQRRSLFQQAQSSHGNLVTAAQATLALKAMGRAR